MLSCVFSGPRRRSVLLCYAGIAIVTALAGGDRVRAAISYTTPGAIYSQDFNGLPTDTQTNNNIQTGASPPFVNYTNGWQDDTTTVAADRISIPGWYLYHPLDPGTEDGFNDRQRFRFGTGTSTAGSFYAFASTNAANPEKALGFLPSTTVATAPQANPTANNDDTMFMALRLTNDTGQTLDRFTLSYDGEQWRDGGRGDQASLTSAVNFSWKINALNVHQIAGFQSVPELGFTSPVANTATDPVDPAAVNGNVAGKVPVAAFTVTGINWPNGADLWLRWGDQQQDGNDHGMAIDNVSFSANIAPVSGGPGDYDNDGKVDAADYVLWRDGGPLQNDPTEGVQDEDYDVWKANFGNPGASSSLATETNPIPEPSTLLLTPAGFALLCVRRRKQSPEFMPIH
jgi:hypothetical protein